MSRLNRVLGTSLPESSIAEARTLDDIVTAIAGSSGTVAGSAPGGPTAGAAAEPFHAKERNSAATASAADKGSPLERRADKDRDRDRLRHLCRWRIYRLAGAGVAAVKAYAIRAARSSNDFDALRIYFRLVGCRLVLIGGRNIEAHSASIYVSNHTSYADVLVVMALFGTNYHFVAKSEINDMPFIGSFLRKIGHFSFERGKIRARSRQIEQMEKALLRGKSVFVFAEGTFTPPSPECVLFIWGRSARPSKREAHRTRGAEGRPRIPSRRHFPAQTAAHYPDGLSGSFPRGRQRRPRMGRSFAAAG